MPILFLSLSLYICVGSISTEHSGTGPSEQHHSTSITSTTLSSTEISHPVGPLSQTAPIENGKTLSVINNGNEVMSVGKEPIGFSPTEQSLNGKLMTNEEDKRNTSVYTTKTGKLRFQNKISY